MDVLGQRTVDEDHTKVLSSLKRPHLEYFKEFYADTAMFGGTYGLPLRHRLLRRRQGGVRDRRAARADPAAHHGARRSSSSKAERATQDDVRQCRGPAEDEAVLIAAVAPTAARR